MNANWKHPEADRFHMQKSLLPFLFWKLTAGGRVRRSRISSSRLAASSVIAASADERAYFRDSLPLSIQG